MKVDPILGWHQMQMMWKSHFFWVRCHLHTLWVIWMDEFGPSPCRTQSLPASSSPTLTPHQQPLTWVYVAAAAMGQALFLQPAPSTEGACFSIAIGGPPFCRNKEQVIIYGWSQPRGPLIPCPLEAFPSFPTMTLLAWAPFPIYSASCQALISFVSDTNVKRKYSTRFKRNVFWVEHSKSFIRKI